MKVTEEGITFIRKTVEGKITYTPNSGEKAQEILDIINESLPKPPHQSNGIEKGRVSHLPSPEEESEEEELQNPKSNHNDQKKPPINQDSIISSLENQIQNNQNEIRDKQDEINDLKQQLLDVQKKLNESSEDSLKKNEEAEALKSNIDDIKNQLKTTIDELNCLTDEKDELSEQCDSLQGDFQKERLKLLQEKTDAEGSLHDGLVESNKQLDLLKKQIRSLDDEILDNQRAILEKQNENNDLQRKLLDTEQKVLALVDHIKTLEKGCKRLAADTLEQQTKAKNNEKQLEIQTAELIARTKERNELSDDCEILQKSLLAHDDQINDLKYQLLDTQGKVQALTDHIKTLEKRCERLAADTLENQTKAKNLEKQLAIKTAELTDRTKERDQLLEICADLKKNLEDLQLNQTKLEKEKKELEEKYNEEVKSFNSQLLDYEQQLFIQDSNLNYKDNLLAEQTNKLIRLQTSLTLQKEIYDKDLANKTKEITALTQKFEQDANAIRKELDGLRKAHEKEVKDKDDLIEGLKNKYASLEKDYKQKLQEKTEEFEKLQKQYQDLQQTHQEELNNQKTILKNAAEAEAAYAHRLTNIQKDASSLYETERKRYVEQLHKALQEISKLEDQLRKLSKQHHALNDQHQENQVLNASLVKNNLQASQALSVSNLESIDLKKEIDSLTAKIALLQKKLSENMDERARESTELLAWIYENDDLIDFIMRYQLEDKLKDKKDPVEILKFMIAYLGVEIRRQDKEISKKDDDILNRLKKIEEKKHIPETFEIETQTDNTEISLKELQEENQRLKQELADLKEENDQISSIYKRIAEQKDHLELRLKEEKEKLKDEIGKNSILENRVIILHELNEELAKKQTKMTTTAKENKDLKIQLENLRGLFEQANKVYDEELSNKVEATEALRSLIEEKEKTIEEQDIRIARLLKDMEPLGIKPDELVKLVFTLNDKIESLNGKIAEMESANKNNHQAVPPMDKQPE
ncbi:MAG TPA: hypothetical protein VLG49_00660 [Rhabdochlamydiaceae bacterium]|nr:hypothetical protein [Rhabdochlamydiaceae bacterium]